MDPFTQLPIEIVEMIMSYLKFYECVSCLRVSKQWKIFLESLSALWTKMDLLRAGAKRTVKPSFVKTCINMAQGKITYARIANFSHRGILQHLVTACKSSLEKLEFVLTPLGPDSILEAVIPARQLRSLIVHADVEMPGHTMWQILKQRPTLEELRVFYLGADSLSNGREYNFDLANLRVLDLRAVHARFLATDAFVCLLLSQQPTAPC
jgi:F-box/TPR repeat protein Pof3